MLRIAILFALLSLAYCMKKSGDEETSHTINIQAGRNTSQIMRFVGGKVKDVSGADSAGEFSIQHGKCSYKNGTVTEDGVTRPATAAEESKVAEFKANMATFSEQMKTKMTEYMQKLIKNNFKQTVQENDDKWPMAPKPPCVCSKCPEE